MPKKSLWLSADERKLAHHYLHLYALGETPIVNSKHKTGRYERASSLSSELWCHPNDWTEVELTLPRGEEKIICDALALPEPDDVDDVNPLFDRVSALLDAPSSVSTHRITSKYGPHWKRIREEIIAKYDEKCAHCGLSREGHYEKYQADIHVHHRTPIREFDSRDLANREQNLVALCAVCHPQAELRGS